MTARSYSDADTGASMAHANTGTRYQYADDTSRVSDFDKDTGSDERIEVGGVDRSDAWFYNGKRTYDLHQTLDTDAVLDKRRQQAKLDSIELAEREQRIRHVEAEFNQRMRHADTMQAMTAGVVGEMVEAIANRTADEVCRRLKD